MNSFITGLNTPLNLLVVPGVAGVAGFQAELSIDRDSRLQVAKGLSVAVPSM